MGIIKGIYYHPELRESVGSINAVILMSYLETCFKEKGQGFYKFLEPCNHMAYQEGSSWIEALHMTITEFRTAFRHIGVVYKSKKEYQLSRDKFQGKMYLSYYDRISKLTYYMRNDELVGAKLKDSTLNESDSCEMNQEPENMKLEKVSYRNEDIQDTEMIDAEFVRKQIIAHKASEKVMLEGVREPENTEDEKYLTGDEVRNDEILDGIINNKSLMSQNTKQNIESKTRLNTSIDHNCNCNNSHQNHTETKTIGQINHEVPLEKIRQLFNQICHSHQGVREWTENQKQKLGQLWWLYDGDLEVFKTAFEKIEESDFLSGRIKSWKAKLDWILGQDHFMAILKDKYRNFREPNGVSQKQDRKPSDWSTRSDQAKQQNAYTYSKSKAKYMEMQTEEERWDFDEIERLERERIDRMLEETMY